MTSQVDAEKAVAEGWWYKPPYIINELNINSAVVYPRHGEVVSFDSHSIARLSLQAELVSPKIDVVFCIC